MKLNWIDKLDFSFKRNNRSEKSQWVYCNNQLIEGYQGSYCNWGESYSKHKSYYDNELKRKLEAKQ